MPAGRSMDLHARPCRQCHIRNAGRLAGKTANTALPRRSSWSLLMRLFDYRELCLSQTPSIDLLPPFQPNFRLVHQSASASISLLPVASCQ
jgi:hypothetical protein